MKAGVLISWGISVCSDKSNLKTISEPSYMLSTSALYILPLNMQGRELLGKRGRLPKMPKKFVCPGINKSTEWHPRVPFSNHCRLRYNLSPQVGLGMHRKLPSTFRYEDSAESTLRVNSLFHESHWTTHVWTCRRSVWMNVIIALQGNSCLALWGEGFLW